MAVLPSNTTMRVIVQYTSQNEPHVLESRPDVPEVNADLVTYVESLIDVMVPIMSSNDSVYGAFYYPLGSNISIPIAVTPTVGAQGVITKTDRNVSAFMSVVGRSVGGHRTRATLFTPTVDGYTYTRGAIGVVPSIFGDFWAFFSGQAPLHTAVDGLETFWKAYVNLGWNSYFQRRER